MPVYIQNIATAVPEAFYTQEEAGHTMVQQFDTESRAARLTRRIYSSSGIDKRHSVIRDFHPGVSAPLFFDYESASFLSPSTKQRNDVYEKEARVLFSQVAATVTDECEAISREDITHVITVSCTGFFAPGPDFYIVKDLGLDPSVKRFHIGFMGCYAAFPALKMAKAFCEAQSDAVVLIVCLELCTLHLEPSEEIDDILATSVFADGAAAAIVSTHASKSANALRLDFFSSTVAPESEGDMAWTIGDHGFDMVLSTYVPRILEANVSEIVDSLLARHGHARSDVNRWAIHPGGRAILDKVEDALALKEPDLNASRTVLKNYGNMSSATILFVLNETRHLPKTEGEERVLAMAFGPGLTVESALLARS